MSKRARIGPERDRKFHLVNSAVAAGALICLQHVSEISIMDYSLPKPLNIRFR